MNPETLTQAIADHISGRQDPRGVPVSQTDQINTAALDGARSFDSLARVGRQTGTFEGDPVDSSSLFEQLAARFGDPLTKPHACIHLAATPIQPGYIHAADPGKVLCTACFKVFALTEGVAMQRYAASTDCDACGEENENFHPGLISSGIVTYVVNLCAGCLPTGP